MIETDPDYILFENLSNLGAGRRRMIAMHQWITVRSEQEFKDAERRCRMVHRIATPVCIHGSGYGEGGGRATGGIPNPCRDAWRCFWRRNAGPHPVLRSSHDGTCAQRIVSSVRVVHGEPLAREPLLAPVDWQVVRSMANETGPGGRLISALIQMVRVPIRTRIGARADTDAAIRALACHDPFSCLNVNRLSRSRSPAALPRSRGVADARSLRRVNGSCVADEGSGTDDPVDPHDAEA